MPDNRLPPPGDRSATPERNHLSRQLSEMGVLFWRLFGRRCLYSVDRLSPASDQDDGRGHPEAKERSF
jgi:hypothetical protein